MIRHVGFLERLLIVRRLQTIRLDDAKHVLHHAIRLQLTRKALVQSNQTIFVVNVEAAQFRVFLDVPAMDGYTVR